MSLEQQMAALTVALEANTQALLGNVGTASTPVSTTPVAPQPVAAPAPSVTTAPVAPVAAPHIPPAVVIPAVVSPSSVMTLEQLQQEVTAIYHNRNSDPQVMATVNQYAASLTEVPAEQYVTLIAALRALP